jgi:hypothetical protein
MAQITDTVEALERLVDAHGLLHILTGLEIMCGEKAMHVQDTWQDKTLAKAWQRAGDAIFKAAASPHVTYLTDIEGRKQD